MKSLGYVGISVSFWYLDEYVSRQGNNGEAILLSLSLSLSLSHHSTLQLILHSLRLLVSFPFFFTNVFQFETMLFFPDISFQLSCWFAVWVYAQRYNFIVLTLQVLSLFSFLLFSEFFPIQISFSTLDCQISFGILIAALPLYHIKRGVVIISKH